MKELIYGIHTVESVLFNAPWKFHEVFILKGRIDKRFTSIINMLKFNNIKFHIKNRKFLDKLSKMSVHQGIVAYLKSSIKFQEKDISLFINEIENPFLLILDGITDPYNLGSCLRIANAAGIHAVIIPKKRSANLNATVKKVACGAAEKVPIIRVSNLMHIINILKKENICIVGSVITGYSHNIYQYKFNNRLALVIGSEKNGIRRIIRENCNDLVNIPMIGSMSSLNASVATGICLFEVIRQRI